MRVRSALLLIALVVLGAWSLRTPAASSEELPLAGLLLTWQDDPTTTMTVDWHYHSAFALPEPLLFYRAVGESEWREHEAAELSHALPDRRIFRAHLTDLLPGTTYEFQIAGHAATYSFRTMPDRLETAFTFAAGGDTRHQKAWMEQMNRVITAYDPEFVVWGGDLAYADGVLAEFWYEWFEAVRSTLITSSGRVIPIVVGIGNHEVQGGFYRSYPEYEETDEWRSRIAPFFYSLFAFPGQPGYGVLDFGDYLSLIVLDTDHTNSVTDVQAVWLEEVLAAREHVTHVIPVYHVTAYPSVRSFGGTTESRIRETWLPLFEAYGVRIAFENHDHAYKRTVPIREGRFDPAGIVFFGDGAWGVTPRDVHPVASTWYLVRAEPVRHGMVVTLDETGVHVLAVSADGQVLDSYKVNGIYIASPAEGATVGADEEIRVWVDPSIEIRNVRVFQNERLLYDGDSLPQGVRLSGEASADGAAQRLAVEVTDAAGRVRRQEALVSVRRVHLRSPEEGVPRVRGHLPVAAAIGLEPGEQVARVRLSLQLIRAFEDHPEVVVFEGRVLPRGFTLDTLQLADGTYDLKLSVETDRGAVSFDVRRIVVRNWETLVEHFFPPANLFGLLLPRLESVERSEGWEYATDQTDRFFGDADRVYPTASGAYMTWRLPRLRRFVLTFYAEDAAFAGYVGLAVSSGNEGWTEIPFRVVQEGEASDGMQRLLLIGEVPEELAAEYIRLTWHGGGGDTVQLGHAEFTGLAGE